RVHPAGRDGAAGAAGYARGLRDRSVAEQGDRRGAPVGHVSLPGDTDAEDLRQRGRGGARCGARVGASRAPAARPARPHRCPENQRMMRRLSRKRIIQLAAALLIVAALTWSFWPSPLPVETAVVDRGPLQEVVEEE